MIASSRIDQLQSEALFADSFIQLVQGDDGPNAIAAARVLAETVLLWRLVLNSKIQR